LLRMLGHPCGPVNSRNCFTPCMPDASSFLPGGAGSTFDISVTPWPSIHVDQASKAFHRLVFSPLLSPSDDPRMASSTEVTYSTYENWFASAPFHELPAEHAAALWTSSFHLLAGGSQKVAFACFVAISIGGP
jgi:hypothetical protein